MKKILVIGSTVADIIVNLDHLPRTGEDVNIKSQEMSLGGCAYNVSDMIRHFGVPYTLFSPVGTGLYGDFVRNQLAAKGLASPIPTPDMPNGCCYCFVESSGERTFVCDRGAEYLFKKEWFDRLDMAKIGSVYICGLEIEDRTGSVIVDFLEENPQLPILFAPGPRIRFIDKKLTERIFRLRPMVHLNEDEILAFTGAASLKEAACALYALIENTVVITSGANGAYYYDGKDFIHIAPVKACAVIDTIGAGDGHCGAVLASLAKGLTVCEAVRTANAVSAMVVENRGATLSDEVFARKFSAFL